MPATNWRPTKAWLDCGNWPTGVGFRNVLVETSFSVFPGIGQTNRSGDGYFDQSDFAICWHFPALTMPTSFPVSEMQTDGEPDRNISWANRVLCFMRGASL